MSWDIVIFNTTETIEDFENFDADNLQPISFDNEFEKHFKNIKTSSDAWEIAGKDFTIIHYPNDELTTNCMVNLYGENAIYALVDLARKNGWQLFDTGLGEMLNLEDPSKNGYADFQKYLDHLFKDNS